MPASKYKIQRQCKVCGTLFFAKTVSSFYCSNKCINAAYRARKREEKKEQLRKEKAAKIPESRPYISVSEAVTLFGVSRDTIYRLIKSGSIPAINMGQRLTRISRMHLENMFPLIEEQPKEHADEVRKLRQHEYDNADLTTNSIQCIDKRNGFPRLGPRT